MFSPQGHVPEKAGHSHALRPVGLRSAWPRRPALSAEEAAGRLCFLGNLLPLKHFPEILYKFTIDFACLKQYGVKVQRPVGRRELFHGFVCSSVPHCSGVLSILWLPLGFDTSFSIYDTDDQKSVMKDVCKKLNIDTKIIKERPSSN